MHKNLANFRNTKIAIVSNLINDAKLLIEATKVLPVACSTIPGKMGPNIQTETASERPSPPQPTEGWTLPPTQCHGRSPAFWGSVFLALIPPLSLPFQLLWLQLLQPNMLPGPFTWKTQEAKVASKNQEERATADIFRQGKCLLHRGKAAATLNKDHRSKVPNPGPVRPRLWHWTETFAVPRTKNSVTPDFPVTTGIIMSSWGEQSFEDNLNETGWWLQDLPMRLFNT